MLTRIFKKRIQDVYCIVNYLKGDKICTGSSHKAIKFCDTGYFYFLILSFFSSMFFFFFLHFIDFYSLFCQILFSIIFFPFNYTLSEKFSNTLVEIQTGICLEQNEEDNILRILTPSGLISIDKKTDVFFDGLFLDRSNIVIFYFIDPLKFLNFDKVLLFNSEGLNCIHRISKKAPMFAISLLMTFENFLQPEMIYCNPKVDFPEAFHNKFFVVSVHENFDDLTALEFYEKNKHLYKSKLKKILPAVNRTFSLSKYEPTENS